MLENEIAVLGSRFNLPNLAFDAAGRIALHIERMGDVHLELHTKNRERELLLYLARPIPASDPAMAQRLLDICHYRHNHPFVLQAGIHKNMCLLLTRFNDKFRAAELEQAILFLSKMMDAAHTAH